MSCARRFSSQNTEAFLLALDRIDAVHREPTPWEAACLFSALGAMAGGNERLAEQKIALCSSASLRQQQTWNVPAGLTVAGLRKALAELRDLERARTVSSRPIAHDDRPVCEWCGRGKLDVIRQWRDPSSGIVGATLECDSPECTKLTVV